MANGGPSNSQVGWGTVVSAAILIITLFGANWMVQKEQYNAIEREISNITANRSTEVSRIREDSLRQITNLDRELESHRKELVGQKEFIATAKSVDDQIRILRERITFLEQTRASEVEVKNLTDSVIARLAALSARITALETSARNGK